MHRITIFSLALSMACFITTASAQQSPDALWQSVPAPTANAGLGYDLVSGLRAYRTFQLDEARMRRIPWNAPHEDTVLARHSHIVISLPMPDGSFQRFAAVESPILSPELAKQYPNIKTFLAQGVDNPVATARLDFTPNGFHAMVITPEGAAFIDPYGPGASGVYICYDRRDSMRPRPPCSVQEYKFPDEGNYEPTFDPLSGQIRRTYRLAVNATGEYTQYFGGVIPIGISSVAIPPSPPAPSPTAWERGAVRAKKRVSCLFACFCLA